MNCMKAPQERHLMAVSVRPVHKQIEQYERHYQPRRGRKPGHERTKKQTRHPEQGPQTNRDRHGQTNGAERPRQQRIGDIGTELRTTDPLAMTRKQSLERNDHHEQCAHPEQRAGPEGQRGNDRRPHNQGTNTTRSKQCHVHSVRPPGQTVISLATDPRIHRADDLALAVRCVPPGGTQ